MALHNSYRIVKEFSFQDFLELFEAAFAAFLSLLENTTVLLIH